ncbi:hypothetical protein BS50DRAFT_586553 [Corynespora cassiicola Philippines]|uniref:Uncharacterized protein n=1 Tax=Corynespora cassiicola Philippines TaxID=1448308 RepID=A0A2T2NUZ6_CORCC|nr:hypothetical protein BS50DRAFT_586553 [Corynespora cassiicola Philippines]
MYLDRNLSITNSSFDPSWFPSNLSHMQFHNCTLAGEWGAVYWRTPGENLPMSLTASLLKDGLLDYLKGENLTILPTEAQALGWLMGRISSGSNDLVLSMEKFAVDNCMREACPRMGWQGNSDLVGVGVRLSFKLFPYISIDTFRQMLVNYAIQAALTTIYAFFFFFKIRHKSLEGMTKNETVIFHSMPAFLNTAIVFCFAMLVAALFVFGSAFKDLKTPITTYSASTTALMSIFTVLPALILNLCAATTLRRSLARKFGWTLISLLTVTVYILFLVRKYMPRQYGNGLTDEAVMGINDPEFQVRWELRCLDKYDLDILTTFTTIALSMILAVGYGCFGGLLSILWAKKPIKAAYLKQWNNTRHTISFCSILGMWIIFAFFAGRITTTTSNYGGKTNKDGEWSFGQALGLATWVPVVVDAFYIYCKDPEDGLTEQLTIPYRVVLGVRGELELPEGETCLGEHAK